MRTYVIVFSINSNIVWTPFCTILSSRFCPYFLRLKSIENKINVQRSYCVTNHAVREMNALHTTEGTIDELGFVAWSSRRGRFNKCVVTCERRDMLAMILNIGTSTTTRETFIQFMLNEKPSKTNDLMDVNTNTSRAKYELVDFFF